MRGSAAVLLAASLACAACTTGSPRSDDAELEVFGPYQATEADHFAEVLRRFESTSGIEVRYVGSVDFVADLLRRAGEGNDPPDVAIVPQLGLVRQLAGDEHIVPLGRQVQDAVAANYPPGGSALGNIDGTQYAVPFRLTVKSLVWYRPDVFDEQGWTVPRSLDELSALVTRIQADTDMAPWCFGIEAGSATGWAATDWPEDLLLRSIGPERYREWASGDVDFGDDDIADAYATFRSLVLDPGRTPDGLTGIVDTAVDEAVDPLFDDPPPCALYKQADFAVGWMPDGTSIGPDGDIDFFVLPGTDDGAAPPILVGGDQAVQFRSEPDVDALMTFMAEPEAGEIWAGRGGFISPNSGVGEDAYPSPYLRVLADALAAAPAIAFDASDQLPPAIGSGLLWSRITDWVAGAVDYATFAADMDAALDAAR